MPSEHTLVEPEDVAAALASPRLTPPPAPAPIGAGAVAELRAAMARFRSGATHAAPRAAVERAVARLDLDVLSVASGDLTRRLRSSASGAPPDTGSDTGAGEHAVDADAGERAVGDERAVVGPTADLGPRADAIADRVPVRALAIALGCPRSELDEVASQVEAVVAVIGRGEPTTPAADDAADRLLRRFARHPDGPVAAVSLLYQVRDATAALIRTTAAHADATRSDHRAAAAIGTAAAQAEEAVARRPSALVGTVRAATVATEIGGCVIEPGDTVRLRFATADQEFGSGPHVCPGAEAARVITAAVLAEIDVHRR
ncbi:MAG: hypothetical protein AAGE88_05015 [Actinomycetota bacterium]